MKTIRSKRYRTYVLRCWRESPPVPAGSPAAGHDSAWRYALLEVLTERPQHGFASFEELVNFLHSDLHRPLETDRKRLRSHRSPL